MNIRRRFLVALCVLVFVVPLLILGVSNELAATATRAKRTKTFAAQRAIVAKLEAYEQEHGRYPESLRALSFTNTPAERELSPEVDKFQYRIDEHGTYALSYDSDGLHIVPGIMKYAQPDGAANRSQPGRSETNQSSAAAGSSR
jgi:hypothetical protein